MIKNSTNKEPKTKMIKTSNIGVYFRECLTNDKKDKTFYFTFKDIATNKKVWVKVGKYSEGIRENATVTLRNEAISKNRHGEDITVQAKKKLKNITTFDEIANEYLEIKNNRNLISRYNKTIKEVFSNKDINSITKEDITKFIKSLIDKDYSASTIRMNIAVIRASFNYAIKEKNLQIFNPCTGVKLPKLDNARERYLSINEINLLKDTVKQTNDKSLYIFLELLLQTGARKFSILTLTKKDFNLEHKEVTIKNHKTNTTYKGFLQDDIIEPLKEYLKQFNLNEYIFTFSDDMMYSSVGHKLLNILNKLFNVGLASNDRKNKVVIHTLRHTVASHLAINGTPIFTIQKLLNHSDITQTMRYAKLSPENGKLAIQGLYK
ncbi:tyrosine-type recombinase/integrase [Aliarcobacter cryaerophilus]|uniref:tyrosine-type recombinase/integrase n=1 Tax=Aliarcobacter cryaerophilus TaxID=28198 RepID=UPI0016547F82|nr:site-specific integrase [Aliarcobacter cryaerophilus]QNM88951.1 site-specific integrase [Aliarcobacter cryaerophilus]